MARKLVVGLIFIMLVGCSLMNGKDRTNRIGAAEGMGKAEKVDKRFEINRANQASTADKSNEETKMIVTGIEAYQVFPSKDGKGSISFRAGEAGKLTARVEDEKGKKIAEGSWDVTAESMKEEIALADVPVGGEYTVRFEQNGREQSIEHILVGELWVVSGQSNALGGPGEPKEPIPQVHIFQGKWRDGRDPMFPWFGEVPISAWVEAAREYYSRTKTPVGLMGYCSPARDIAYFMNVFQSGMDQIAPIVKQHGQGASVYMWYQGESDIEVPKRLVYKDKLNIMAKDLRAFSNNPDMTMVIVQLSYLLPFNPGTPVWGKMREVQRQFCAEDKNAILVPALPYSHKDPIHLGAEGQIELGKRIGQALAEAKQAGKPVWQGPRAVSAKFADGSRKRIRVEFDNAKELRLTDEFIGKFIEPGKKAEEAKVDHRDPKEDWFVTDAKHHGVPEFLSGKIEGNTLRIVMDGATLQRPKVEKEGEEAVFELADQGYLRPVKVTADGLSIILELAEPAAENARVSYALYSDSRATLIDEQGKPAAAFADLAVAE